MSNAAIYARVSSTRQKEQETIRSQTAALRAHAEQLGLDVPEHWVFEDDGHSGASLVRPALERLRDLVCQVPVDVLLVYSPDRLARKYAYQALLIEEFAKAGTTVMFVKGPRSDSPEDALLVQFQGMIAEYERAQILERTRRGKAHRAKSGTINVLSGAPFGYRYVRKSEHAEARYEVVAHEAAIVAELFARYADGGVAIGELARWLSGLGVLTRTGKPRWDRSTVWGMLRNPAYAPIRSPGSTAPPAWPGAPHPATTRSPTATAKIGSRYRCPRWSPRTPGSGSSAAWPTISATPPETASIPRCCKAFAPAAAAATPTTARRHAPPTRRSTTTAAWARTTTATSTAGSAPTSRCAPTTSTPSSGTTSPPCLPTRP
jgi:DNA invertase Pin-like site-specific DNA recombinase